MSVIKSKRSEADCLYVYNALELRRFTRDQCKKLPKRRTFYGNTLIAELSSQVAEHAVEANEIYPLNEHEVQMRRDHVLCAKGKLAALTTEVNELRRSDLLNEKVYLHWSRLIDDEDRLLAGVLKKDRERYKNLQKE